MINTAKAIHRQDSRSPTLPALRDALLDPTMLGALLFGRNSCGGPPDGLGWATYIERASETARPVTDRDLTSLHRHLKVLGYRVSPQLLAQALAAAPPEHDAQCKSWRRA